MGDYQHTLIKDKKSLNQVLFPYYVKMDEEGNALKSTISYDLVEHFFNNEKCSNYIKNIVKIPDGWRNLLIAISWSKDKETAIKVANERRTCLIALNQ